MRELILHLSSNCYKSTQITHNLDALLKQKTSSLPLIICFLRGEVKNSDASSGTIIVHYQNLYAHTFQYLFILASIIIYE